MKRPPPVKVTARRNLLRTLGAAVVGAGSIPLLQAAAGPAAVLTPSPPTTDHSNRPASLQGDTTMPAIEASEILQSLQDRIAITDLIHAYCFHFDRNEPDALTALFTADAEVDYGPEFPALKGTQAIRTAVGRGLEELFAATSHHISNVDIRFNDADHAQSICYLYAWHRYRNDAPDSELWAQYHHRFVRQPDGWRIASLMLKAAGMKDFHRGTMHPIGRR